MVIVAKDFLRFVPAMKTLGKFEILEKVGQGAMGVVYKARDPFIGRLVALKTITTGLADDPALLQRFYQEARSAGALEHPNIVTIYELGKEGDTPFIAMQFLEGESLDKLLERRSALPLSQKISFVVYVCRALEFAHKRGVVHRDIKPGNVMVAGDGTVKVVDFGIARLGDTGKTQTGLMIGTLGYMSPQQFRNIPAEARSDIWAVGVMFYEILAGQRPFVGDNPGTLMMNIMMQEPASITDAAPGTPPDVAAVIERMLKKEIEQRFQSMEEVLIELEPIWKRLQQAEVSGLVQNGEALFKAGNLAAAQDILIKACKLDTSYTQARILLEQINSEIKRSQILPQVKKRVEKSQNFLAAGQLEEAKAEAEAALQLDSTFQPAREMLAQVQVAADRARDIALALRTSKQRLAEGSFTEAELQLTKVLEIDASNAAAQGLLRQIREEKVRRERQRRLSESLHRARTLWTELRYDECIQLLLSAQEEFPGEPEITKLLETARQDQSEQVKQGLLTEARNLVRAQHFDDALATLDRILEQFSSDPTARNLRTLALQGRQQQIRERQLKEELANLRKLVKEEKYQEAIVRGEQLLKDSPNEFELSELVTYARNEQSRNEQKRRLDLWLEKVNQAIKANRFQEAIQSAEIGLGEFPRNMDLMTLLNRAKTQKEEKEKRELLEQRIKEVKNRINREELTGAIDLARQTLVHLGPDTDISQLLHQAEVEIEQRDNKKRQQEELVQAARTLVDAGNFGDATMMLQRAVETRIFSDSDPLLGELLHEINTKQPPPPPAPKPSAPKTSGPGMAPWTTPTGDPGKDYVYQRGGALPDAPVTSHQDAAASAIFSATSVTGPSIQPVSPPAPPLEKKAPGKPAKPKRQQQAPAPAEPDPFGATSIAQPAPQVEEKRPSLYEQPPVVTPPQRRAEPLPEPAARPFWKQPLAIAGLGVTLVLVGGITVFLLNRSTPTNTAVVRQVPPEPNPAANSESNSRVAPTPAPSEPLRTSSPVTSVPTPAPTTAPTRPAPSSAPSPAAVPPRSNPAPAPPAGGPVPTAAPAAAAPTPVPSPTPEPPKSNSPPIPPPATSPTPEPPKANPAPPPASASEPPKSANSSPPSGASGPPTENPEVAISKVFDDLSHVFANKDMNTLRQMWPSIPGKTAGTLQTSFGAVKSFSRVFTPAKTTVNGDNATVAGSYSGAFVIGSSSTPSNGSFQATLKREGSRWVIMSLTM
ncbi:MAG TPA: protein kinase [Candidatus Acidoferrales bacterium]|nr:protein kinase [Candidatus Acidoferrales bacterium]